MTSSLSPTPEQLAAWRAQVDKELAGAPFEKLVQLTAEGIALQPLYTERAVAPPPPGVAPFVRGASLDSVRNAAGELRPFAICMRVDPPATRRPEALAEDIDGGADALWADVRDRAAFAAAHARGLPMVLDVALSDDEAPEPDEDLDDEDEGDDESTAAMWYGFDWIDAVARGRASADHLDEAYLQSLAAMIGRGREGDVAVERSDTRTVRVSSLAFHDAGADAAEELALVLASGAAYLRALTRGGASIDDAAAAMWLQVAVGRDTFGELCKLRALRVVWHKLLAAAGARDTALSALHAVCSSRTQSQRDPWVNLLRGTTQVFAAALGGARLITPLAFDEALGVPSALGRRVARNTALVLREESHLGRVRDAGGGSYYLEARTDALAREAWSRFTALERDGGIARALASGALRERLATAWKARAAAIAKRKEPVLGVSEFANLVEQLPAPVPPLVQAPPAPALIPHRDSEGFEALRTRVEAGPRVEGIAPATPASVALILLGPASEHRGRQGYAAAFFATVGLRATDLAAPEVGSGGALGEAIAQLDIACLCGSDERYAAEAVAHASELRAAGARKIVLAGRPGALEAELRSAGVTAFIYVGCDVLATLTELLS